MTDADDPVVGGLEREDDIDVVHAALDGAPSEDVTDPASAVGDEIRPETAQLGATAAKHLALGSNVRGVQVRLALTTGPVKVYISSGSVVHFNGDAIVNAANTGGVSGMGLDEAINNAGGAQLHKARKALPVLSGSQNSGTRIKIGDAKTTIGGDLAAKWVVHAVGPNFSVAPRTPDKLLYRAYKATLEEAARHNVCSIAFSMLSAGLFRGNRSIEKILEIACLAVKECIYDGLHEVHLVAFRDSELQILMRIAPSIFGS